MKSTHSLFYRFAHVDTFRSAYERISLKNSSPGLDRVSVEEFGKKLEKNIQLLLNRILDGSYVPEPVAAIHLPKFNKGREWREIGLQSVADKVVQTALLQVVEPLAEKLFLNNSYGYRPGKGPHKALRRVEHMLTCEKRTWVVSHDIDNFFDSLDHQRLLSLWEKLVDGDQRLVELAELWCCMGIVQQDGCWRNVQTGIRQGQVLAPLFANLYLHDFDVSMVSRGLGFVRYSDDFLILCNDEEQAIAANQEAQEFLSTIKLSLNDNPAPISSLSRGFTFLGVHFHEDNRKISEKKIQKMETKVGWLLNLQRDGNIEELMVRLRKTLTGWQNYYSFLRPVSEFLKINKKISSALAGWSQMQSTEEGIPDITCPLLNTDFKNPRPAVKEEKLKDLFVRNTRCDKPIQHQISAAEKINRRRRKHRKREVSKGVLIVNTPGTFIGKRGERVVVRLKQVILAEILSIQLKRILISGKGVSLSADVILLCARRDINVSFVDGFGRTYSQARPPEGVDSELVLHQICHRDSEKGYHLACMFVWGKMKNQLALLKSYMKYERHRQGKFGRRYERVYPEMVALLDQVKGLRESPKDKSNIRQTLMGLEGRFAAHYWKLISFLLPANAAFTGRVGKGAKDIVNSLLNYGYGILYNQAMQALEQNGLNTAAGFLHTTKGSKASLVYDLVEEFRATVVDRAVFTMLNRKRKLVLDEDGLLEKDSRKILIQAILNRLGQEVKGRGKALTLQEMIHRQAQLLKSYLMDKSVYKPYLARW